MSNEMTDKPEALRLANALWPWHEGVTNNLSLAAAELRRLHLVEQALKRCKAVCDATSEGWRVDAEMLTAQRDELLEALKYHQEQTRPIQRTIDAIAKVEGQK